MAVVIVIAVTTMVTDMVMAPRITVIITTMDHTAVKCHLHLDPVDHMATAPVCGVAPRWDHQ